MNFLTEHPEALGSIGLGLAAIFWPLPKRGGRERHRQARVAELDSGAEERFFEERRQLESYGPKSAGPFRLLDVLIVLLGIAGLFF